MFSHIETFILFALSVIQGVLISAVIQRLVEWPVVLTLAGGCVVGFILASVELSVFYHLCNRNK
jgi:hypothetical protein